MKMLTKYDTRITRILDDDIEKVLECARQTENDLTYTFFNDIRNKVKQLYGKS